MDEVDAVFCRTQGKRFSSKLSSIVKMNGGWQTITGQSPTTFRSTSHDAFSKTMCRIARATDVDDGCSRLR